MEEENSLAASWTDNRSKYQLNVCAINKMLCCLSKTFGSILSTNILIVVLFYWIFKSLVIRILIGQSELCPFPVLITTLNHQAYFFWLDTVGDLLLDDAGDEVDDVEDL